MGIRRFDLLMMRLSLQGKSHLSGGMRQQIRLKRSSGCQMLFDNVPVNKGTTLEVWISGIGCEKKDSRTVNVNDEDLTLRFDNLGVVQQMEFAKGTNVLIYVFPRNVVNVE